MENELRRIGMVDYKFNLDSDYEKCMAVIDEMWWCPSTNVHTGGECWVFRGVLGFQG